ECWDLYSAPALLPRKRPTGITKSGFSITSGGHGSVDPNTICCSTLHPSKRHLLCMEGWCSWTARLSFPWGMDPWLDALNLPPPPSPLLWFPLLLSRVVPCVPRLAQEVVES